MKPFSGLYAVHHVTVTNRNTLLKEKLQAALPQHMSVPAAKVPQEGKIEEVKQGAIDSSGIQNDPAGRSPNYPQIKADTGMVAESRLPCAARQRDILSSSVSTPREHAAEGALKNGMGFRKGGN